MNRIKAKGPTTRPRHMVVLVGLGGVLTAAADVILTVVPSAGSACLNSSAVAFVCPSLHAALEAAGKLSDTSATVRFNGTVSVSEPLHLQVVGGAIHKRDLCYIQLRCPSAGCYSIPTPTPRVLQLRPSHSKVLRVQQSMVGRFQACSKFPAVVQLPSTTSHSVQDLSHISER